MDWQQYQISDCQTHHLLENGMPAYQARFDGVLAFHAPGLAPVLKNSFAWHICPDGNAAYQVRFARTFGFYCHRAAVVDNNWFHIFPDGTAVYPERYAWCGNYQEGLCSVRNHQSDYFHIDLSGKRLYSENWRYCGDFREGIAVVQNSHGLSTHINREGHFLHGIWFVDLDVFHKGFARAKNKDGWLHINHHGQPIYGQRYANIEPFYNGFARVEGHDGRLEIIDETGVIVHSLRSQIQSSFASLSADLVGYWRTFTLGAAVELGIFEVLPASLTTLTKTLNLDLPRLHRLLWALAELGVIEECGEWRIKDKGYYLLQSHELSLADAALEYQGDLLQRWKMLPEIIRGMPIQQDLFKQVAQDNLRRDQHHRMLSSYATNDYPALIPFFNFIPGMRVLDAAGGQGTLAKLLAAHYPDIEIICADLPNVVQNLTNNAVKFYGFDLFADWHIKVDRIILARVLHDWDDEQVINILQNAANSLNPGGEVIIIEMLRPQNSAFGALCDLHLLVATGGQERTATHYQSLLYEAGFIASEPIQGSGLVSLINACKEDTK